MDRREQLYALRQQSRWMKHDAARWLRSDAARFLPHGAKVQDAFPTLARKYSDSQPRVPGGNGRDSGRWTNGGSGGGSNRPRVIIDTTDLNTTFENTSGDAGDSSDFDLFDITPRDNSVDGVQLAGDPPRGIGDNGGPLLEEPPNIPEARPVRSSERTAIQRNVASWLGRAIGLGVAIDIYEGGMRQVEWLQQYEATIETYRDPPRTLEELRESVQTPRASTEKHHIMEQTPLEYWGLGRSEINAPENLVRIPTLKHCDITAWYRTKNQDFGWLTPREYLADKPLAERMRVGLYVLRLMKVLK